jgi:thiamine pyrophosphate-dependent acetolactate synthase large subunit-like protein
MKNYMNTDEVLHLLCQIITKEQRAGGWDKWATDLINPNFAEYAKSCGGLGIKIDSKENLESAMKSLMEYNGPGFLEVSAADVKLI